jgi:hypothetical protein
MNYKIRKLLDKKNITSEEFGKAYITTRLWDKLTNGKELILTDEELKNLADRITEPLEINQVNAYVNFHTWLDRSHLVAKSHYNHFFVGLSILYLKLGSTADSEQGLNNLKKMTEDLKEGNNYQQLKTFTENILFSMSVFNQIEEDKESLEFMENARNIIKAALPNILSYNKAVDLFTNFFKMPEISQVFKIETQMLFTGINMLNDKIVLVRNFLYGSKKETIKKLKVLDDIYPIIDIPNFEPTEAAIKKASKLIKESILSYNPYEIMKILNSEK